MNRTSITIDKAFDLSVERSDLNGFNVMFTSDAQQRHNIAGCPLGRGATVDAAIADLKRRTEIESPVSITFVDGETFKDYADALVMINKRGDHITWHTAEDIREHLIARKHSIIRKFGPDAIWDIREYLENHWGITA